MSTPFAVALATITALSLLGLPIGHAMIAGSILYLLAAGPRLRRSVAALVAAATLTLFALALPASIKYVAFMKVESTSYLKIRLDVLYSVYVLFALAVIVRSAFAIWAALRGELEAEVDVTQKGYGL